MEKDFCARRGQRSPAHLILARARACLGWIFHTTSTQLQGAAQAFQSTSRHVFDMP
jgi:ribulose-5-phosphate 4-epimerase/fuculose-1-phosphate aldolase